MPATNNDRHLSIIPIPQLEPGLNPTTTAFRGFICLIWPYSSSKQSLSILVRDTTPDPRQRRSQVRVNLHGHSAKAAAAAQLTVGDEVLLHLTGADWLNAQPLNQTPGKSIEWDLKFTRRLTLEVHRNSTEPIVVSVDRNSPTPEAVVSSPVHEDLGLDQATPSPTTPRTVRTPSAWASPAFLKSQRLSKVFAPLDDNATEDAEDPPRYKKLKLGLRSSQWRFSQRTPSPERTDFADDRSPEKDVELIKAGAAVAATTTQTEVLETLEPTHDDFQRGMIPTTNTFIVTDDTQSVDLATIPVVQAGADALAVEHVQELEALAEVLEPTDTVTTAQATDTVSVQGASDFMIPELPSPFDPNFIGSLSQLPSPLSTTFAADTSFSGLPVANSAEAGPFPLDEESLFTQIEDTAQAELSAGYSFQPHLIDEIQPPASAVAEQVHSPKQDLQAYTTSASTPRPSSSPVELSQQWATSPDSSRLVFGNLEGLSEAFEPPLADNTINRASQQDQSAIDTSGTTPRNAIEISDGESESDDDEDDDEDVDAHVHVHAHDALAESEDTDGDREALETERYYEGGFVSGSASSRYGMTGDEEDTESSGSEGDNAVKEQSEEPSGDVDDNTSGSRSSRSSESIAANAEDVEMLSQIEIPASHQDYHQPLLTPQASTLQERSPAAQHEEDPTMKYAVDEIAQTGPAKQMESPVESQVGARQSAEVPAPPVEYPDLRSPERKAALPDISSPTAAEGDDTKPRSELKDITASEQVEEDLGLRANAATVRPSDEEKAGATQDQTAEFVGEKEEPQTTSQVASPPKGVSSEAQALSEVESKAFKGFRTPLSYFAALASVSEHFSNLVDVIAVVVSTTRAIRARTGPRDYTLTMCLSDPSSASEESPYTRAQIFRPTRTALPEAGTGDAVLLRNFKVQMQNQKVMLLSCESSAWAVFGDAYKDGYEVRGPPVELGTEEQAFAKGVREWWQMLSGEVRDDVEEAVSREKRPGKATLDSPSSARRIPAQRHVLRDGVSYTDDNADLKASHELRNGVRYTDN